MTNRNEWISVKELDGESGFAERGGRNMRLIDADELAERLALLGEKVLLDDKVWGVLLEIDKSPTVEPKRGKWKVIFVTDDEIPLNECSECGHEIWGDADYCPKCGAKMDGEQNES